MYKRQALVWPALLATEYERGKPIQRQLQLVSAAEVLRLVFWMLTKYAGCLLYTSRCV